MIVLWVQDGYAFRLKTFDESLIGVEAANDE